uniref:Uncharacterized protein n=1 Tax=Amphimedon queenslandica TaxID=400682 RepID=A0A1X7SY64_AMPQE
MQNVEVFVTTSYFLDGEECKSGWSNQSPKGVSSPSSDTELTCSSKNKRHSSSLPDINQLKSSFPSYPVYPCPVLTITPVFGLPEQTFVTLTSCGCGVIRQAVPPIFFSNIPQAAMGDSI